jgi:hypothetical protein
LKHIDWTSPPEKICDARSVIGIDKSKSEDVPSKMYTGDPYKGMEVFIQQGEAKMHFGVVKGSREKDGRTIVDVLTTTRTVNGVYALDLDSVRERT